MVDMHSHIIPGIDDGSKSVDETFKMITEARRAGFTDVILTPHCLTNHYEPTTGEIILWKNKLQEIINNQKMEINLHSGMEIYISNQMEDLVKDNSILTLADSKYMLVELPLSSTVSFFDYVLYFLQSISVQLILAHPERYKSVQENPELVEDYIDKGALIQCNYGSILGLYGNAAEKTMKTLLKNHQVHFLGSDCHRVKTIYPLIPQAVRRIKRIVGEKEFKKISTENPQKVLKNKEL